MFFSLITDKSISSFALTQESSGLHPLEHPDCPGMRLGHIEVKENKWILTPKGGIELKDTEGLSTKCILIDQTQEQAFRFASENICSTLICRPSTKGDKCFQVVGYPKDCTLTFGRDPDNTYAYLSPFVSDHHARLEYECEVFTLTDLGSKYGTFLNGHRLGQGLSTRLKPGDIGEIAGLKFCCGHRFLSMNKPFALTITQDEDFIYFKCPDWGGEKQEAEEEPQDFFYPAPRFKREIVCKTFDIDAPPPPETPDETPVAMKIGPSMVMSFAAVFSGTVMFVNVMDSGGSITRALPMLVMALSMVTGAILWPLLSRKYQNKKNARTEAKRRSAYAQYLDKVRIHLRKEMELQKEILNENRIGTKECARRALKQDAHLMDRSYAHSDFMELRVGTGKVAFVADVRYPEEHFSVEEDDLAGVVYALSKEPTDIEAPLALDLKASPVVGITGTEALRSSFVAGLLIQVACLHSYEEVKIVLLSDPSTEGEWEWARSLPHTQDDAGTLRFVATSLEDAQELTLVLAGIAAKRTETHSAKDKMHTPHYLIVSTSKYMTDKAGLVASIAHTAPPHFSVITLADTLKDLPKTCTSVIEVEKECASIRSKTDKAGGAHLFAPDIFVSEPHARQIMYALGHIHLDIQSTKGVLPDNLSFLDMFEVGSLSQLNVSTRWRKTQGFASLATPVGRDTQGEPFTLNLHEKFHGPHGLIAGTTGSGKSEFIISWILSMCVNYSPQEVAFVLIDYKGGGLAGAFDSESARLPHLAGTITNLDGPSIARSLVSIKSELKRRQALFNEAREISGGDNIDIYSYLELFRTGKIDTPCPHLFIVADEFAELKQQESEFMDELISAARIGRSLGVHLVLATQKPTGVVNDQIWSNARFKVCLKVADKADSQEMIKRADAAEITRAGRFYLLVGYNEYFALGQSAYTGSPYLEHDQYTPPKDDAVELVSSTGGILASVRPKSHSPLIKPPSELVAVLGHLDEVAKAEGLFARPLWTEPLPAHITVDELEAKYSRTLSDSFELDPVVGEIDDPANQTKHLLTLPLSREGNAVVYGASERGVETFLLTALFDLISTHSPRTLNLYALDLGSETLGLLKKSLQVGEVIFSSEEEKIRRLFTFLEKEIENRKKLYAQVGGNFSTYNHRLNEPLPAILVVINNMAAFYEMYEEYERYLVALTRDAVRYGMYFLVSATGQGSIRMRLRGNFKQDFVIQPNEDNEYASILGSMRGVVAPLGFGRGLVKKDRQILEFQTAEICSPEEDHLLCIENKISSTNREKTERARPLPTMPTRLTADFLRHQICERVKNDVPYGLFEKDLAVANFLFKEKVIERVVYGQAKSAKDFLEAFVPLLVLDKTFSLAGIDASDFLKYLNCANDINILCADKRAVEALKKIKSQKTADKRERLYIVSGLNNLLTRISGHEAEEIRKELGSLRLQDGVRILLVDNAGAVGNLVNESWFKEHSSNRDGLWTGKGLTSQLALTLGYGSNLVDLNIADDMGYLVVGGVPSLVKLLSN